MTHSLLPHQVCPCRVCQSDLAYILPCEQPLIFETIAPVTFVLVDGTAPVSDTVTIAPSEGNKSDQSDKKDTPKPTP